MLSKHASKYLLCYDGHNVEIVEKQFVSNLVLEMINNCNKNDGKIF